MTTPPSTAAVLGKLVLLAAFGFLVLMVIGPILAFLTLLLTFAAFGALGLAAYYGVRSLLYGRDERPRGKFAAVERLLAGGWYGCRGCVGWVGRCWERGACVAPRLGRLLYEALCGGLVGAVLGLLGVLAGGPNWGRYPYILWGTAVGAVLGLTVGLTRGDTGQAAGSSPS
jgi:hypothetical protein